MIKKHIQRGLALTLLVGSLSFSCSNKSNEIYNKKTNQEAIQNTNLENKVDTLIIPNENDSAVYHIIQKGDTYDLLAQEYWGTDKEADEIEKLNPGIDYKKLKIGQKIRVK